MAFSLVRKGAALCATTSLILSSIAPCALSFPLPRSAPHEWKTEALCERLLAGYEEPFDHQAARLALEASIAGSVPNHFLSFADGGTASSPDHSRPTLATVFRRLLDQPSEGPFTEHDIHLMLSGFPADSVHEALQRLLRLRVISIASGPVVRYRVTSIASEPRVDIIARLNDADSLDPKSPAFDAIQKDIAKELSQLLLANWTTRYQKAGARLALGRWSTHTPERGDPFEFEMLQSVDPENDIGGLADFRLLQQLMHLLPQEDPANPIDDNAIEWKTQEEREQFIQNIGKLLDRLVSDWKILSRNEASRLRAALVYLLNIESGTQDDIEPELAKQLLKVLSLQPPHVGLTAEEIAAHVTLDDALISPYLPAGRFSQLKQGSIHLAKWVQEHLGAIIDLGNPEKTNSGYKFPSRNAVAPRTPRASSFLSLRHALRSLPFGLDSSLVRLHLERLTELGLLARSGPRENPEFAIAGLFAGHTGNIVHFYSLLAEKRFHQHYAQTQQDVFTLLIPALTTLTERVLPATRATAEPVPNSPFSVQTVTGNHYIPAHGFEIGETRELILNNRQTPDRFFSRDSANLMTLFYESAELGISPSLELLNAARRHVQSMDDFTEARGQFILLLELNRNLSSTLWLMHDIGLLGHLLPTFAKLHSLASRNADSLSADYWTLQGFATFEAFRDSPDAKVTSSPEHLLLQQLSPIEQDDVSAPASGMSDEESEKGLAALGGDDFDKMMARMINPVLGAPPSAEIREKNKLRENKLLFKDMERIDIETNPDPRQLAVSIRLALLLLHTGAGIFPGASTAAAVSAEQSTLTLNLFALTDQQKSQIHWLILNQHVLNGAADALVQKDLLPQELDALSLDEELDLSLLLALYFLSIASKSAASAISPTALVQSGYFDRMHTIYGLFVASAGQALVPTSTTLRQRLQEQLLGSQNVIRDQILGWAQNNPKLVANAHELADQIIDLFPTLYLAGLSSDRLNTLLLFFTRVEQAPSDSGDFVEVGTVLYADEPSVEFRIGTAHDSSDYLMQISGLLAAHGFSISRVLVTSVRNNHRFYFLRGNFIEPFDINLGEEALLLKAELAAIRSHPQRESLADIFRFHGREYTFEFSPSTFQISQPDITFESDANGQSVLRLKVPNGRGLLHVIGRVLEGYGIVIDGLNGQTHRLHTDDYLAVTMPTSNPFSFRVLTESEKRSIVNILAELLAKVQINDADIDQAIASAARPTAERVAAAVTGLLSATATVRQDAEEQLTHWLESKSLSTVPLLSIVLPSLFELVTSPVPADTYKAAARLLERDFWDAILRETLDHEKTPAEGFHAHAMATVSDLIRYLLIGIHKTPIYYGILAFQKDRSTFDRFYELMKKLLAFRTRYFNKPTSEEVLAGYFQLINDIDRSFATVISQLWSYYPLRIKMEELEESVLKLDKYLSNNPNLLAAG